MKYILLFVVVITIILWGERLYWKRRAELGEFRSARWNRADYVKSFIDAWIDTRLDNRIQKLKDNRPDDS